MKKLFLTFIIAFTFCSSAIAQPTLTQANFSFNFPDSVVYFIADSLSLIDNTVGPDVTFDYSRLRGYGQLQTGYYFDPTTTAGAASFPTATLAENTDASPQNFIYTLSTIDSLTTIGFLADISGFGLTTGKYNVDPEKIMDFPFNYGDSFTDNYAGSFSANISPIGLVTTNAAGTVNISADAWGKLIFSSSLAFDSVIRVTRVENTITDPIVSIVTIPAITVHAVMTNYYKPAISKAPLLSFVDGYYMQSGSIIQSTKTIVSQYPMPIVSIEELTIFNSLELYPNPTSNITTLSLTTLKPLKIKIEVLNSLGQSILEIANTEAITGLNNFEIPTNQLSPGLYFISVQLDGKSKGAKKLIVE